MSDLQEGVTHIWGKPRAQQDHARGECKGEAMPLPLQQARAHGLRRSECTGWLYLLQALPVPGMQSSCPTGEGSLSSVTLADKQRGCRPHSRADSAQPGWCCRVGLWHSPAQGWLALPSH